jgi:menaquinone-dependent protoporphyrinogen oxidase
MEAAMRVLIVYGTALGQTRKIANFLAERFRDQSHVVDVLDLGRKAAGHDPADFDATIVASPIRMGSYNSAVIRFARNNRAALLAKPSALISVSLAAVNANRALAESELRKRLATFVEKTGWTPAHVYQVAGSLPYTRYNFITRWVMRRIARDQGYDTDTTRDYEYTDWEALGELGDGFLAAAALPESVARGTASTVQ